MFNCKEAMLQLLLLTVLTVAVFSTDIKQRLENVPVPLKTYDVNAVLGQWFVQFRRAPCSWPGSSMFTDYEVIVTRDVKKGLLNHLTWRSNGICNRITSSGLVAAPGVLGIEDNIGDIFSGSFIPVATDYRQFAIYWGCSRMLGSGTKCVDPWLSISTRARFPPKKVVNMIEYILRLRWGITIGELQKVSHTMPCQQTIQKKCKY